MSHAINFPKPTTPTTPIKHMHHLKHLLCTGILCVMAAPAASAAVITVIYSGYGHNGQAGLPAVATPFNTNNVDTSGSFFTTHSANVTTSDGLATGTRTFTLNDTGSGTGNFSASSNLMSQATINDPGYTANKQLDGGGYRYVGFTVDTPGLYNFEFFLNTRNRVSAPGGAGQYAYYGLGGSGSVEINNFPAANTSLYNTGSTGNIGDPAINSTVASFTTTLSLNAGVQYQLNFNSYMYSGFGGTGTIEHNSGWNVNVIAPVPEPSTAMLGGVAALALLRRRRSRF